MQHVKDSPHTSRLSGSQAMAASGLASERGRQLAVIKE